MSRESEEDATIPREGAGDMCSGTVDSYLHGDDDGDLDDDDDRGDDDGYYDDYDYDVMVMKMIRRGD
jgi:hypothetical protein